MAHKFEVIEPERGLFSKPECDGAMVTDTVC